MTKASRFVKKVLNKIETGYTRDRPTNKRSPRRIPPTPQQATNDFSLTTRQLEANEILAGNQTHTLLRGGARSGKTFLICRAIGIRALRTPETSHAIMRFRFNHIKESIVYDTMPKVFKLCFPEIRWNVNKTDWFTELPNHSRIYYGGLDDEERTEKILGQEHASIFLNECSQITYDARNKAVTRLASNSPLKLRMYYDCNPPSVGHWLYRLFEQKREPKSGAFLVDPGDYTSFQINPVHNKDNLKKEFFANLEALPEKDRRRFLLGEYLPQVEGALWTLDQIDRNRERRPAPDDEPAWEQLRRRMQRIVVAVDPSGCRGPEDTRSDEIGIIVVGLGFDKKVYVLDDISGRYSPRGWAQATLIAFDRWEADKIIGEVNYGGGLVESTIRTERRSAAYKEVRASRGKAIRAEPVSACYDRDEVIHVGAFPDLEDQMCMFSNAGYQGPLSPDRADAMIWGVTELGVRSPPNQRIYTARGPQISIFAR